MTGYLAAAARRSGRTGRPGPWTSPRAPGMPIGHPAREPDDVRLKQGLDRIEPRTRPAPAKTRRRPVPPGRPLLP
ncbi:hypothetical protein [Lysobacter gummosus]|uniref:hypothetical protein n=1 Tax=Lysobacter gummosus TaxID=262324 RepID=UPI003645142B